MSEFMPLEEKKLEEIHVESTFQEEFQKAVNIDLEEQRKRFQEKKAGKLANKKKTETKEMSPVSMTETLKNGWVVVDEHMPPKVPESVMENTKERILIKNPMPETMMTLLDEVLTWKKVKEGTSIPVKEAAKALKKAKTDEDAAEALSGLALACTNYIEQNGSKIFKSSRRKKLVHNILESISDFMVNANSIYVNTLEMDLARVNYKTASSFGETVESKIIEHEGGETYSEATRRKADKEDAVREIESKKTSEAREAIERREEYRKHVPEDYAAANSLDVFTDKDRQAEYAELKKNTPEMTEEDYQIYERFHSAVRFKDNPEYLAIYERAKNNYKNAGGGTYTREAFNLIRQVNFDKNFKPISEKDKENHEWNLKMLKAFEENDIELQDQMIKQELPHFLDDIEIPTMITKEELDSLKNEKNPEETKKKTAKIREKLDKWCDDIIKNGDPALITQLKLRSLNIDSMKKLHPGVKDYLDNNKAFKTKSFAIDVLNNYISFYSQKNYFVELNAEVKAVNTVEKCSTEHDRKNYYKVLGQQADLSFESLLLAMGDMYEHANDEGKEYETDETVTKKIEHQRKAAFERKKIEERREANKERDAVRDQILKEEEEKRQEKEKIREENKKRESKQEETTSKEETKAEEKKEEKKPKYKLSKRQLKAKQRLRRKVNARDNSTLKANLESAEALLTKSINLYQNRTTEEYRDTLSEHIYVSEEIPTVQEKQRNAMRMDGSIRAVVDEKVKLRDNVPLELKKKIDYKTLMNLSDIAFMTGGQKELNRLVEITGEARRQIKSREKQNNKIDTYEGLSTYPVLDYMTSEIMKIDASSFDISSDEAISKNAVQLEKLSRGIEAYRKMVQELGGEAYFNHLSERNIEGVEGDMGQMVMEQYQTLQTIARYYRTRRLVMEDEGYIEAKEEISLETNEKDSFETKRLKELINKSREMETILEYETCERSRYAEDMLQGYDEEEKELCRLEKERYFVAPKWLQNAVSLTNLKDRNTDDNPAFASVLNRADDDMYTYVFLHEKTGCTEHQKAYEEVQKSTKNKVFKGSPSFSNGKEEYLGKTSFSDHLDRMNGQVVNAHSYRRTGEETREMLRAFAIQQTEEWENIKKDPEAVAFYESYFKEMTMQHIEAVYANVSRVARAIGPQILVMHPADLAMQMTTRLRAEMMGAIVFTNIDLNKGNMDMVEKLFKENDKEGRYIFDRRDFSDMGSVISNSTMKAANQFSRMKEVAYAYSGVDPESLEINTEMDIFDLKELLFGNINNRAEAQEIKDKEIERLTKLAKKDPTAKKRLKMYKSLTLEYIYLANHPEFFTMKNLLAKTEEGNLIVGDYMEQTGRTIYLNTNAPGIKNCLDKGKLREISKEELDTYEKSLKDRKMPAYMIEGDPYGINLYKTKLDALMEKDEKGEPIMEDGQYKMKNILTFKSLDPITGKPIEEK